MSDPQGNKLKVTVKPDQNKVVIRHPDGGREVIIPNVKLVYKPTKTRLQFRHKEVLEDGSTRILFGRIGKRGKTDRVVIKVVEAGAESTPALLYQLHTDQLATIHTITDKDQTIVWRGEHDAFGQTYATIEELDNPLRFPGQYYDEETGLHYNWHRYYDPATGRYISSDPIGLAGGLNTFGYVGQRPTVLVDPDGLNPFAGAVSGGIIAGPPGGVLGALLGGGAAYIVFNEDGSEQAPEQCLDAPGTPSGDPDCDDINRRVQETKGPVKGFGRGQGACRPGMSRFQLQERLNAWLDHAVARSQSIKRCWNGGDDGHQEATSQAWVHVARCQSLL